MNDLRTTFSELFEEVREKTLASETVRVLTQYQFDRAAAAYSLVMNGMVWDAEILVRVIYETASKIIFIGAHAPEFREQLIDEYWETLPAIFDRKGAARAADAERVRKRFHPNEDDIRVFRHLRNPAIFKTEAIGNKRFRDEVERRWSFSDIVRELIASSPRHLTVPGLDSLTHIYGMASHLAHASPKALDLMEDRVTRQEDLLALEAGHICRILSDIVTMTCFSIRFSERVATGAENLAEHLNGRVLMMLEATASIQQEFARSQDEFYAKYE